MNCKGVWASKRCWASVGGCDLQFLRFECSGDWAGVLHWLGGASIHPMQRFIAVIFRKRPDQLPWKPRNRGEPDTNPAELPPFDQCIDQGERSMHESHCNRLSNRAASENSAMHQSKINQLPLSTQRTSPDTPEPQNNNI